MCGCYRVGKTTIVPIVEQQGPFFEPRTFFPDMSEELFLENLHWLKPTFIDPQSGKVILCVQSYLIKTAHHTILVDTCVGNHKPRPGRGVWDMLASDRYERNLAAAGVDVNDVDFVMCTHLHIDHVGWNTRLQDGRWVPTFPKARYVLSARELEYWTDRHKKDPASCPWITDSVLPVVECQQVELVASDHVLSDDVQLMPAPGHTIDHYAVKVASGGEAAIITGDLIHSPLQMRYPELGIFADFDRELGNRTRRRILEDICDTSTLFCTAHFPTPSTGLVTRWGEGFRFNPQEPERAA
jgi:glyoxylase-like metal-dependent hydrolase (beta-lactamase superfamily II)